ncbi:hypothetical protein NPX13_g7460 [Xylaria arbuscula]|uniref:Large ribosomal subunit protein bL21m n=1 Tax=Xylaria arbuscula TaxID=114810 RepID=A0A9W8NAH8_9PEZI|nr:hypothetical protein NPX13_g7460 [Xylaria arbuscula]
MSRTLLRSVLELRTPLARLPSSSLVPKSRALSTTRTVMQSIDAAASPQHRKIPPIAYTNPIPTTPPNPPETGSHCSFRSRSRRLSRPAISSATGATTTLHHSPHTRRPYLVTEGDQIRLPFKMPGVLPGDVLRLDRASVLGSRDYTLKGTPYIDSKLFECRATVLGTESEPLRIKIKTKRRNRRSQRVTSKHKYTMLRISELKLIEPSS